jgi:hypothetical protein
VEKVNPEKIENSLWPFLGTGTWNFMGRGVVMLRSSKYILFLVGLFLILLSKTVYAAWVQSEHQGMIIRHPKGWQVSWEKNQVTVTHPQNPNIWCFSQQYEWNGSSKQLAQFVVNDLRTRVKDLKVLSEKQISQRPDNYGVKITYKSGGLSVGSVVLTSTEEGNRFLIRNYGAPVQVYDEMRLTLIPILLSFASKAGGSTDKVSGPWQILQSPRGIWRFRAPTSWKVVDNPSTEDFNAMIAGPNGEGVAVRIGGGWGDYLILVSKGLAAGTMSSEIPFLQAAELYQSIAAPCFALIRSLPDLKILDLKPLNVDIARYAITFTYRDGVHYMFEGLFKNNSIPTLRGGDFNLYMDYQVGTPSQKFPSLKNELWQILSTFEPSQYFGASIMQDIARLRRDTQQAMTNMALQNMQTNKQIMQQHVGIAQQKVDAMRVQGEGWINAVTGQEVVRDPQTGQHYQVPVGGQYMYGRGTEIIRSDRALGYNELPEGFRQLEAASVYDKK